MKNRNTLAFMEHWADATFEDKLGLLKPGMSCQGGNVVVKWLKNGQYFNAKFECSAMVAVSYDKTHDYDECSTHLKYLTIIEWMGLEKEFEEAWPKYIESVREEAEAYRVFAIDRWSEDLREGFTTPEEYRRLTGEDAPADFIAEGRVKNLEQVRENLKLQKMEPELAEQYQDPSWR